MNDKEKVIECLHCGNKTLMHRIGKYVNKWANEDESFYGDSIYEFFYCPICNKPTLTEDYWESDYPCSRDKYSNIDTIYPVDRIQQTNSHVIPEKIKSAYLASVKAKNIDIPTCLMALRRTLELLAIDKGATKYKLHEKINELAEKGVLPECLEKPSSFLREFGNYSAHDKNELEKVDIHHVNNLLEFTQQLIEYLYILPYNIERFQKRWDAIKGNYTSGQ